MSVPQRFKASPIGAVTRVGQLISTVTHRHTDEIDQRIRGLLGDDRQWHLVARLSAFDRAHHLAVHDLLVSQGFDDPHLLRAALLHDIGKANGIHQVRLWDRVARVVGRKCTPAFWRRMASSRYRFCEGMFLAEHHAELGASALIAAGVSERCRELIRRHEEVPPTGDPLLDALIEADEAACP